MTNDHLSPHHRRIRSSMFGIEYSIFDIRNWILVLPSLTIAANLANPATPIPGARAAVGISYNLTASTITNDSVPCLMNRLHLRASYAPVSFVNFGIDAGASNMEVAPETTSTDSFGAFHGNFGFSGGAHLKLSTPFFFNDFLAVIGIGQATYFSSENKYQAKYGGIDVTGGAGIQLHVKKFGFVTLGAEMYLIEGTNTSYDGVEGEYSNLNNFRGWAAVDFFPAFSMGGGSKPYLSVEVSISPYAEFGGNVPVREFSFSVSLGSVTKRLYGEATDIEWQP